MRSWFSDNTKRLSALVLIRTPGTFDSEKPKGNTCVGPFDLTSAALAGTIGTSFGTGFFVHRSGTVLTADHNLRDERDQLCRWVWVCRYDPIVRDWTAAFVVDTHEALCHPQLDAAVLHDRRLEPSDVFSASSRWKDNDSAVIRGFHLAGARRSGFDAYSVECRIGSEPRHNFGTPVLPLRHVVDPTTGFGLSGGPVFDTDLVGSPAVAIQKSGFPERVSVHTSRDDDTTFVPLEFGATPISWLHPQFKTLESMAL